MQAATPAPATAGAAEAPRFTSPPRPRLAFRVGIVGHRPNRLPADHAPLARHLRAVLEAVKEAAEAFQAANPGCYEAAPPILRALTPIAEGTDRLFAEAALALGYELCCPMPFFQHEYQKDFQAPASRVAGSERAFLDLLGRARNGPGLTTFELDGCRSDSGAAYGAAGRVVLNQSDLLVVVWDGRPAAGRGGTVNTMYEAKGYHVPILWIDAVPPHGCQLLQADADLPDSPEGEERRVPEGGGELPLAEVRELVTKTLECPRDEAPPARQPEGASWWRALVDPIGAILGRWRTGTHEAFARERRPRLHGWFVWRFFRDLVGDGKWALQRLTVEDFESAVAGKWPVEPADVGHRRALSGVEMWVNRRLRPFYAWSDRPALLKSDAYRSTFVLAYLLAAAAVFLALLPGALTGMGHEPLERAWAWSELAVLGAIVLLVGCGWWWRWHDRWVDYRLLGERIRQLRLLVPLGGGRPFVRQPPYLETYPNPERSWMSWYMRGAARQIGIPSARVNQDYLAECLRYVEGVVDEQLAFHARTMGRDGRIAHRLHLATVLALVISVLVVLAHLLLQVSPAWKGWLTLASAGFPALGAALAGIANQGEFARVAKRSSAMRQRFEQFKKQIAELRAAGAGLTSAAVTALATEIAQLMVDEVLDWRVVFLDRPLRTP